MKSPVSSVSKRFRRLMFLLLALGPLLASAHGPTDYAALYEEASKTVVGVFPLGGSGVIISPEGHILTNAHVIYDYESREVVMSTVVLHDGSVVKAEVIGYDHYSDIALLQIDVDEPLPAAKIGDLNDLRTGDPVLAIGHPEGHYYSLSTGVVSSTQRVLPGPNLEAPAVCSIPWIQTDAVINGGNSGGPLLNDSGEVIGIISWSDSWGPDDNGLNFAVPIKWAMFIQDELLASGSIRWGILGVYADYTTVTDAMGDNINGLVVTQVNKGSGAEAAGIEVGDVIIEYNHEQVYDGFFRCVPEGVEIPVTLMRGEEEIDLSVTLSAIVSDGFLSFLDSREFPSSPIQATGIMPSSDGSLLASE